MSAKHRCVRSAREDHPAQKDAPDVNDVDGFPVSGPLHHAGVCVGKMAESLRFYRDGLGLTVLVDTVLRADLEPLLGVSTHEVRTVFLGSSARCDSGIVELLDLGVESVSGGRRQAGLPARGIFLLSFQVDVEATLSRLQRLGLGGDPRVMTVEGGASAATVVDPDGVLVELLPMGPLAIMRSTAGD
ncbi:MAG: VOC family protein [Mycobacterium sp.]|uniref:VOC family protein n=1 Tax=Mycobacterium sp. TaxID=1785 RepID=UPI003CC52C09